ncbi:MAG TPA: hypothetical protein PKL14_11790 [Holophaga sp.]|nr:hypothetical protein [Holophaga sp.]
MRKLLIIAGMALALPVCGQTQPQTRSQLSHAKKPSPDGALLAISEGGGRVRLLVWPPLMTPLPPGGWQVQDANGQALSTLRPGDSKALKGVPPEEALEIARFPAQLAAEGDLGKRRLLALNALVTAGNRPEIGKALGLGCSIEGQRLGRRSYVVVGLDASGKAQGPRLTSPEVDPGLISPLPGAPTGLRAEATKEAVQLFWAPVNGGEVPVLDYRIQRGDQVLTSEPRVMGLWDTAKPAFEDREAPGDQASEYRVWAVDIFGRRGPDVATGVYFPDPATLRPPTRLSAKAEPGSNVLRFQPSPTRHSSGILVERATQPTGPFELLTAHPLSSTAGDFSDGTVGGGQTYYYRLRAVDLEGNVGDPGPTVYAIAQSKDRPAPPADFAITQNALGNVLTWKAADTAIAGYLVERRKEGGEWTRLKPTRGTESGLVDGNRFEDQLEAETSGVLSYRVTTITLDNLVGQPSAVVSVTRANLATPEPPIFLGISGRDGQAHLEFRPAAPEARTAQILVLRSTKHQGKNAPEPFGVELVVGDPLPGDAREFTDAWVEPGETYRYRLVSVSPEGMRSAISPGVEARIGAPPIPEPPRPTLTFMDSPFRHVLVKLTEIPEGFRAYLHRKGPGETLWTEIQGPFTETEVVDPRPIQGHIEYRIHLEDSHGLTGRSGQPVSIDVHQ